MGIRCLCKKYAITDKQWRTSINELVRYLFLENLFPKCDGTDSDVVTQALRSLALKDNDGEIYICHGKASTNATFTIFLQVSEKF
jgi:hypothetical protein